MANYANTKSIIAQNIYTNHEGKVTAEMVKTAANEIVNTLIAGGYLYAGVAHPGDAAVSPDANVFYIATEPGTYTNKGGLVVADGEVAILKFNGTWSKEVTGAATAAQVTELGQALFNSTNTPEFVNIKRGYYLTSSGTLVANPPSAVVKYIVSGISRVFVTGRVGPMGAYALCAFFDSADNLVGIFAGTPSSNYNDYGIDVPNGASYILVGTGNIQTLYPFVRLYSIPYISEAVENLVSRIPIAKISRHYVNSSGVLVSNTPSCVWKYPVTAGENILVSGYVGPEDLYALGAFYDASDNLVSVVSGLATTYYYDHLVTVPTGAKYILISTGNVAKMPFAFCRSSLILKNWESAKFMSEEIDGVSECVFIKGDNISPLQTINNSYLDNNGIVVSHSGPKTLKFDVQGLQGVLITGRQGTPTGSFAIAAFYNSQDQVVKVITKKPGTSYEDLPIIVPNDASYIYVCTSSSAYPNVSCAAGIPVNNISPNQLSIPSYWKSYLDAKIATINAKNYSIAGNGDNFVFITDIHQNYNNGVSPRLIKYILENTSVRNVCMGGDYFSGASSKAQGLAYIQDVKNDYYFTNKVFACVGNHDYEQSITSGEFYSIFDRPLEDFVPTLVAGKTYFYRDNSVQKIRYIFLDAAYPASAMTESRIAWLQGLITELGSDWKVVVFAHSYWDATYINAQSTISTYGQSLVAAIDAVVDVASATIVALIVGHTHCDRYAVSAKGYPIISTTCDAGGVLASNFDPVTPNRTPGTISEQAFDVFNIDTANRKIYATRIGGNGSDREFTY